MGNSDAKCSKVLIISVYLYMLFPVALFLIGWCKPYIGIPVTLLMFYGMFLCLKQHNFKELVTWNYKQLEENKGKLLVAGLMITLWVVMSGIGAQIWQNDDHFWRNTIFDMLMKYDWPVISPVKVGNLIEKRGMIYYIAFWLPAALFGKAFGPEAGYCFQIVWAVIGVVLMYAMVCTWRKKIEIWPLVVLMLFSGADYLGDLLLTNNNITIWASEHLERWAAHIQYLGMTTQLFWVFNHAVPAWVMCAFIFLFEKPKNMVYVVAVNLLASIFACVGVVPFAIFFMATRSQWKESYKKLGDWLKDVWKNWASVQNIPVALCIVVVMFFYYIGNAASSKVLSGISMSSIIKLFILFLVALLGMWIIFKLYVSGKKAVLSVGGLLVAMAFLILLLPGNTDIYWPTPFYVWVMITSFYFIEVGIFIPLLDTSVISKRLLMLTQICLYFIPLIKVGKSSDFCMKASLPGLFLIMLFCILTIDVCKKNWKKYALIGIMLIGSITSVHEIKRSYEKTRTDYEITRVKEAEIIGEYNFSGSIDSFFWKYVAK
ncbi:MAG: hypothetical protein ACI4EK_02865 [Wujia sp.]